MRIDLIGLEGGLNTYNYVYDSSLHYNDSYGLYADRVTITCARASTFFCFYWCVISAGAPSTVPDSDVEGDLYCPPDNAIFAKGGKQNIDNEYVRLVQSQRPSDPCEFLKKLHTSETNKVKRGKIKIAMKRYNCDGKNRYDKK